MRTHKNDELVVQYFTTEDKKTEDTLLVVDDLDSCVNRLIQGSVHFSVILSSPQHGFEGGPRQILSNLKGHVTPQGITYKLRHCAGSVFDLPIHLRGRGSVVLQGTLDAAQALIPDEECTKQLGAYTQSEKDSLKKSESAEAEEVVPDDPAKVETPAEPTKGKVEKKAKVKPKKTEVKKNNTDTSADSTKIFQSCKKLYWDDRTLGCLCTSPYNYGWSGACRLTHAVSLNPIEILDYTIVSTTLPNYKVLAEKDQNLGQAAVVEFGCYEYGFNINPIAASKNGFTWHDLNVLLTLIPTLWPLTASMLRVDVNHERMTLFVHENELGSGLSLNALRNLAKPTCNVAADLPAQSMGDYTFPTKEAIEEALPKRKVPGGPPQAKFIVAII